MGHKLLLADDSITIQKVVELVLAGEGFDIKATNNGDEALSARPSFNPDVILADIAMPVMNGYQLCEKIKSNPETRNIPVILLAGAFEPIDEALARKVGADDYIVKPFESQDLISKVNAVIAREAGEGVSGERPEAEAVEAVVAEEDLWTMEEIGAEAASEEAVTPETLLGEVAGLGEAFEPIEEIKAEIDEQEFQPLSVEESIIEEFVAQPETVPAPEAQPPAFLQPQIEVPSRDEVVEIFRKAVDEKVASLVSAEDIRHSLKGAIEQRIVPAVSAIDVKDSLLAATAPAIRESAETVMSEIAPKIIERILSEKLQDVMASLSKEIEKVIWETVPQLAETMISKEIEKIKAEM
ncbi:MAG TPA: response regulator [Thermodesulfovibrionales bacterium]|nr:response regulator [Thermodesulfovibrionales bacterium]